MEKAILTGRRIGRHVKIYEEVDSTMRVAHQLAEIGEPDGTVIVARTQTRGRGRLGRSWYSPAGTGIYLSVILRPTVSVSRVAVMSVLAAVAVAQMIEEESSLKPQVKWPNDVLCGGKKISGILTELNTAHGHVHSVILGIGININTPCSVLPETATSLAEEIGKSLDLSQCLHSLLIRLDSLYEQFLRGDSEPIFQEWRRRAAMLGCRVRIEAQGNSIEGQAMDIDSTGAILIRTDSGLVESVAAGHLRVIG